MQTVQFQDLGLMRYQTAWDYQTSVHRQLVENKLKNKHLPPQSYPQEHQLLFVEHPPVYTLGKSGSMKNLLLSEAELIERGLEFFPINRGGDITFHGPGQIVGYPILDLECFFTDVHRYVRNIEEVIIRTIAEYGIEGLRIKDYTGVWVEGLGFRGEGLGLREEGLGLREEGLGLREEGLGLREEGLGLREEGLGFRVEGLGLREEGLGFREEGLGFRVEGLGLRTAAESSRLTHNPSTLNPKPSTLNPKPSTLNPKPSTLNPNPSSLNPKPSSLNPKHLKICAIGVHLSRWTTLHGWAFNVNTSLEYFDNIIPCGINDAEKSVTSLAQLLGHEVDMEEVKEKLKRHFGEVFECEIED